MTAQQNEALRKAVLHCLAIRSPTALPMSAIRSRLVGDREVDFQFGTDDLSAALNFLRGLGYVRFTHDDLGSTSYWLATAEGILADERGTVPQ